MNTIKKLSELAVYLKRQSKPILSVIMNSCIRNCVPDVIS